MKKTLLVLAAGLVFGSWAQADEATWKWDGEIRTRFGVEMNNNGDDSDGSDPDNRFDQRNKVGVTVAKGENLSGHVGVINHFQWGNSLPSTRTGTSNAPVMNVTNGGDGVYVHEAYMWWKANDMFSLKAGRGGFELADGTVVSKFDYAQHPYTFDGVAGVFDFDFGGLTLFGVKGNDPATAGTTAQDAETNFYGASLDLKNLPDAISMLNVFYMKINVDPVAAASNNYFDTARMGLTVAGDISGFDYRATYTTHSGTARDPNGDGDGGDDADVDQSMYDVEVGYTMADMMNMRIWGTYHSDSGDDDTSDDKLKSYNGFYYDMHRYAGMMDTVGWGNLTYFGVGLTLEPTEGVKAGLGYFSFTRTEVSDGATAATSNALENFTIDDAEEAALGTEIDVWVEKAYEGGFSLGLRYGMFTPGAYFDPADPHSDIELTAKLDF